MKTKKTIAWRKFMVTACAMIFGLMVLSTAYAQRGGGNGGARSGGGGRGGGQSGQVGGRGGGNQMKASNFSRGGMQRSGGSQMGANSFSRGSSQTGANSLSRGGNQMGASNLSRGGIQRSGGTSSVKQGGAGIGSSRSSSPSANVVQRSFSSGGNKAQGNSAVMARGSGGSNSVNRGSSNFVQKNFGNSASVGNSNAERRGVQANSAANPSRGGSDFVKRNFDNVGETSGKGKNGAANPSRGGSDFVKRNFDNVGETSGKGKSGIGTSRINGQRTVALNNPGTGKGNDFSRNGSGKDFSNNWNGRSKDGNWNNDWNGNSKGKNWNNDGNHDWDDNGHHHDNWSHYYHRPFYGYGNYGNYGYYPYRYGYNYWPWIALGWGLLGHHFDYGGYGYGGYGYGGYGYGGEVIYDSGYSSNTTYYAAPIDSTTVQGVDPAAVAPNSAQVGTVNFAAQGESDFRGGKYAESAKAFRHALVEDPNNGPYVMILGQALFANGQYNEAAGATQQAAQMLPQDKWGTIVANYKELYSNVGDYTSQLRALEKARDAKPEDPALHFLLGWHYGYLGYRAQAVQELDKTLELIPADPIAKKLRDAMTEKPPSSELPAPQSVEKSAPTDVK